MPVGYSGREPRKTNKGANTCSAKKNSSGMPAAYLRTCRGRCRELDSRREVRENAAGKAERVEGCSRRVHLLGTPPTPAGTPRTTASPRAAVLVPSGGRRPRWSLQVLVCGRHLEPFCEPDKTRVLYSSQLRTTQPPKGGGIRRRRPQVLGVVGTKLEFCPVHFVAGEAVRVVRGKAAPAAAGVPRIWCSGVTSHQNRGWK